MRINKSFFLLFAILTMLSCGCNDKKEADKSKTNTTTKAPAIQVEASVIKVQSISDNIEVAGSILPFESTEIHPEVSGRVVTLNVKEGAFVGKGTLLAKINDNDLQAQLKKLQVQLDIAQQTENRSSQLLKIQGISQQDYDLSLLQVNNIKADIEIVRAAISKTVILAPFSGKLGLKNISPGAFITPATIITTIGQVSQLKLQFAIPEKYGSQIKNGQNIDFTIDGSPNIYHAAVSATEISIEENSRSLSVRAIVKSQDAFLIPGAFAKIKIELGKNENAIMIPTVAVVPQGRKKQVYLLKNGKAIPAEITTGVRDSANIQVITGLNLGDTVITTGLLFLKPGIDVKITKAYTPTP
jgi:membrane fusion protein (multidrug efflux system)